MPRLPHPTAMRIPGLMRFAVFDCAPLPPDLAGDIGDGGLRGGLADELNGWDVHGNLMEDHGWRR